MNFSSREDEEDEEDEVLSILLADLRRLLLKLNCMMSFDVIDACLWQ